MESDRTVFRFRREGLCSIGSRATLYAAERPRLSRPTSEEGPATEVVVGAGSSSDRRPMALRLLGDGLRPCWAQGHTGALPERESAAPGIVRPRALDSLLQATSRASVVTSPERRREAPSREGVYSSASRLFSFRMGRRFDVLSSASSRTCRFRGRWWPRAF